MGRGARRDPRRDAWPWWRWPIRPASDEPAFGDGAVMRATAPLLLHIFATFSTGGAQVRFATIANRLGGAFRHAIFAMDGHYEARALLDPALDIRFPRGRRGQRRHARQSAPFPCRAARSAAGPAGDQQLGQHRMGVGADRHGRAASAHGRWLRSGGAHTPAAAPCAGAPVAATPCHGGGAVGLAGTSGA